MNVVLIIGVSSAIAVATLLLTLGDNEEEEETEDDEDDENNEGEAWSVALAGRLATALATLVWLAAVASIVIWGFS